MKKIEALKAKQNGKGNYVLTQREFEKVWWERYGAIKVQLNGEDEKKKKASKLKSQKT